jgi:BirA family biotin operon repressor/biotin-[acetyl-CoA-carboxylase] ligase
LERYKLHIVQTDSTNSALKQLMKEGCSFPHYCIYTDFQTEGKGQRGNSWLSQPGENLLCSFLVRDALLPQELSQLNLAAMTAVHHCLEYFGVFDSKVKWPNDLYIYDRKVCGILTENTFSGQTLSYSVVGIGLNINQTAFEIPGVCSMKMLTGKHFSVEQVLDVLYDQFYMALSQTGTRLLNYANKMLYKQGEMVNFVTAEGSVPFRVLGLSPHGDLEVQGEEGKRLLQHPKFKWSDDSLH